jgi:hypothetical protein
VFAFSQLTLLKRLFRNAHDPGFDQRRLAARKAMRSMAKEPLRDDGTLEIEFKYRNGDQAVLKAKRDPSSTAC